MMAKLSQHTHTVLGTLVPVANASVADPFSPDGGSCTEWICVANFDDIEFELITGKGWAGEQPNVWVEYANINPNTQTFSLDNVKKGKLYEFQVTQRPDETDPLLLPITKCQYSDTDKETRDFLLPGTEDTIVEVDWCSSDIDDEYSYVRLCYDAGSAAAAPLLISVQVYGLSNRGCKCCPSVFPKAIPVETPVVPPPESNVSVEIDIANITPSEGNNIIIELFAFSNGINAMNVVGNFLLPAGLTFVSSPQTNYNPVTGIWTIGDMFGFGFSFVQINATVDAGTSGTTIVNTVTISADEVDTNPANNTDSTSITVQ